MVLCESGVLDYQEFVFNRLGRAIMYLLALMLSAFTFTFCHVPLTGTISNIYLLLVTTRRMVRSAHVAPSQKTLHCSVRFCRFK